MPKQTKVSSEPARLAPIIGLIVAAVVLVGLLGYVVVSHMGAPEPVVPPGQTLQNPFGSTPPGPHPASPTVGNTAPSMPAPGTGDPVHGFGPSRGGPFQRK